MNALNELQTLPRPVSPQERAGDGETRFKVRCDLDLFTENRDEFGRLVKNRMGLPAHIGRTQYWLAKPGDVERVKEMHAATTGVTAELARREKAGEPAPVSTWVVTELPD